MPLVPMKEILDRASSQGYAVGAFNTNNFEFTKAILKTAEAEKSPVIISASEGAVSYMGAREIVATVTAVAMRHNVPVALHLDHGRKFDVILECLRAGFTSVMIDASHLPFEENVALTKKVVDICHPMGVSVEAELGKIAGKEEHVVSLESSLTDPDEAERFVAETGVDALAVAIGTAHGPRKFAGKPKLAIDLVAEIKRRVGIPLVLHGASGVPQEIVERGNRAGARWSGTKGVPDESVAAAVKNGINKVNIDTDMKLAFMCAVRETLLAKPEVTDPRDVLRPAIELIGEVVRHKMRLLGSSGRVM